MVTINFTLVVELLLFLLFLWGTNRFILRPTVKTIDEREALIEHNEELTERDVTDADALEERHAAELSLLYRETEERVREARRAAINARTDRVQQEMKQTDAEIAQYRDEMRARIEEQRPAARKIAPEVAEAIEAHFDRGVRV